MRFWPNAYDSPMSRIHDLAKQAEDLGIADPMADVMAAYLDQAEHAASEFQGFHWGDAIEGGDWVDLPPPPLVLAQIGPLVEITYEASKRGEVAHWTHDFKDPLPVLAWDPMAGGLYIVGGGYKVTPRGIVG